MPQPEATTAPLHEKLGSVCIISTAFLAAVCDGRSVNERISVRVTVKCLPYAHSRCGFCGLTEIWKPSESVSSKDVNM
jgi:hypothetical protein